MTTNPVRGLEAKLPGHLEDMGATEVRIASCSTETYGTPFACSLRLNGACVLQRSQLLPGPVERIHAPQLASSRIECCSIIDRRFPGAPINEKNASWATHTNCVPSLWSLSQRQARTNREYFQHAATRLVASDWSRCCAPKRTGCQCLNMGAGDALGCHL